MADLVGTLQGYLSAILQNPVYLLLAVGVLALLMLIVVLHRIHKIHSEEIFARVAGKVVEANKTLADQPELVNKDPYGAGWMAVLEVADPKAVAPLMDAAAYRRHIGE